MLCVHIRNKFSFETGGKKVSLNYILRLYLKKTPNHRTGCDVNLE